MKKILILLTILVMCVSCSDVSYRETDRFIIKGVKLCSNRYRYEYTVYHIITDKLAYETTLYSNEKYELNDTLRLMK